LGASTVGDASTELQAAIDLWVAQQEAGISSTLHVHEVYTTNSPLLANFDDDTVDVVAGGGINMAGGKIISNLSSAGVLFEIRNRTEVRGLFFKYLHFQGSSNDTVTFLIDAGSNGVTPKQFIYNVVLRNLRVDGAPNCAFKVTGNAFEYDIENINLKCTSTTSGTYALHLEDTATANPSSINIRGAWLRGGENCLFVDSVGDVKIHGLTGLESGEYVVRLDNSIGCVVDSCHIESGWVGGSGSDLAGLRMSNSGMITNTTFTSNSVKGAQDTGIEVYSAAQGILVDNVVLSGDTTKSVNVLSGGAVGLRLQNVPRDKVTFANNADARLAGFDGGGRCLRNAAATGTIAVDRSAYDWIDLVATGNVSISTPTGGVAGDEITVSVKQDGTGGRSVTFSAGYATSLAADTTADLTTSWTFRYNGGTWIQVGGVPGV